MRQPILLADLIAGHDNGTAAATDTSLVGMIGARSRRARCPGLAKRPAPAAQRADSCRRRLHGERANQQQRAPEPAVSAVTAAVITHAQTRASDRRIRPLAPDAHAALVAYLGERVDLMTHVCCWADDLDPPPRLRRTPTSIARLAASVRRRADMLLAVINRPPRP